MSGRVPWRREQRQAGSQLQVALDQHVLGVDGPAHRPRVAEVPRRAALSLPARDDDRGVREVVQSADVVDVAVRDDEVGDLLDAESGEPELRLRSVRGRQRDDSTEGIEPVSATGCVRVFPVRLRKAGVDEDDARAADDDVAENRDAAAILRDLERPVVEDSEEVCVPAGSAQK